ncbi:MAG TPA: ChrR family anti-sigma-E factor [Candidatus Limnocylindrales bacterium]|nr:ChrR family anti-sigma-E factor [Candidatus Limnocylindrales bacterium]
MTAPHFHPGDDLLMSYAAGALPEAPSVVIAAHASLCVTCSQDLQRLDEVGGAMMAQAEPAALPASVKQGVLERLARTAERQPRESPYSHGVLPQPVRDYASADAEALAWRKMARGAQAFDLAPRWDGKPLRLVRLQHGFVIPRHRHTGRELTLVVAGELVDESGTYGRGDVRDCDTEVEHRPRVTSAQPCICLIANSGRIVPRKWLARLLVRLSGA